MDDLTTLYELCVLTAVILGIIAVAIGIHRAFRPIEGATNETDADPDALTPEQAFLTNNILAKIAEDDPELSNIFNITVIRTLNLTNPQFVSILDKDISVKQKMFALSLLCKSTRPALPTGFAYAELPDVLFGRKSPPINNCSSNKIKGGNFSNFSGKDRNIAGKAGKKVKGMFKKKKK